MTIVQIEIDLESCRQSQAGLVEAGILLRIGEFAFPAEQWLDNVVVVLSWWNNGALQLLRRASRRIEVRFMEGPYVSDIALATPGLWHGAFVEAGLKRRVHREATFEARPFVGSILSASDQVLALCRQQQWWSTDADELAASADALREVGGFSS